MKTLSLLMITVRVTATTTHRTVFIIVIKKEKKQFFSFKAIWDVKIFGLQKILNVYTFRHFFVWKFFCLKFVALNVEDFALDNIFIDEISHEHILIYTISYKTLIGSKPLQSRFDKIDEIKRIYDRTRHLTFFDTFLRQN